MPKSRQPSRKLSDTTAAAPFDTIAIVASAGGLSAISQILSSLPENLPATILIVQHLHPNFRSRMADILGTRTQLKVKQAEDSEQVTEGTVYIAPPNKHMLINADGTLSLTQTELVHFLRPSGDLLLESVADSYQQTAIAVVLTGTGNDGSLGVKAIKKKGGTVIVQDPEGSQFDGMPKAAIATGSADFVLPLVDIAAKLSELVI